MLAGVTARMRLLSRAMNCRIMSRIWNSMSCGWSPTGTLVIPGRSISVRFSTEEHRGVSAGVARSSARSLQDPQSSPHFNSGPPKLPPFQLRIPHVPSGPPKQLHFPLRTQEQPSHSFRPPFALWPPQFPFRTPKAAPIPLRTPKAALVPLQDPQSSPHFPSGPLTSLQDSPFPLRTPKAAPVSLEDPRAALTSLQAPPFALRPPQFPFRTPKAAPISLQDPQSSPRPPRRPEEADRVASRRAG